MFVYNRNYRSFGISNKPLRLTELGISIQFQATDAKEMKIFLAINMLMRKVPQLQGPLVRRPMSKGFLYILIDV